MVVNEIYEIHPNNITERLNLCVHKTSKRKSIGIV